MNKTDIYKWLSDMLENGTSGVFFSIRFSVPQNTKTQLCNNIKPIFYRFFRIALGRHWRKRYTNYFTLIGFEEFGHFNNRHAHFILICCKPLPMNTIVQNFKQSAQHLKIDIWTDEQDKTNNPKQYASDIMVTDIYSNGVCTYATKEILYKSLRLKGDPFILDADLIF